VIALKKYINYLLTFKKFYYLFTILVKRNIKKKYKGSALGILWSLLNPLLNMIVLTIVFSTLFRRSIENFPVYLLSGRLIFGFFSSSTSTSLRSIINSAPLLKKVYIPKYIMTLADITANFITFMISMLDLIIVILITRAEITLNIIYAPIILILLFVFVCGVSLILSTITVFFRDISYLYQVSLTMLVYASAVFYPKEIIPPKYQFILTFNPVFHYIEGFRQSVYYGLPPEIDNLIICTLIAFVSIVVGIVVFEKNQDKFMLHI
jgi:ABC-type polysaccharide/polyol phosphate export permease